MSRSELVEVSVGVTPDLRLHFGSGHRLETFGNHSDGYRWYYRERMTGEVFEAHAAGVRHEFAEQAE